MNTVVRHVQFNDNLEQARYTNVKSQEEQMQSDVDLSQKSEADLDAELHGDGGAGRDNGLGDSIRPKDGVNKCSSDLQL